MRIPPLIFCGIVVVGVVGTGATVPDAGDAGASTEGFIQEDALGRLGVDYLATDWDGIEPDLAVVDEPVPAVSATERATPASLRSSKGWISRRGRAARIVGIVALGLGVIVGVLSGRLQPLYFGLRSRLRILFRRRKVIAGRPPPPSRDRRLHLVLEDAFVGELAAGLARDRGFVVVCHRKVADLPPGASWVCAWMSGWEAGVDRLLPARERTGRTVALLLSEATRSQVWAAVGRGAVACRTGPLDLDCLGQVLDRLASFRETGSLADVVDELTTDLVAAGPPTPAIVARTMGTLGAKVRGLVRDGWLGGRIIRHGRSGFIVVEGASGARRRRLLPLRGRNLPVVHLGRRSLAGIRAVPALPFARAWARIALEGNMEPGRSEMLDGLLRVARGD